MAICSSGIKAAKMGCVIKAESHRVEFAFLLEAEYADDVLEYFDQPHPPMQLKYLDKQGRRQTPLHTADYFVLSYHSAGWQECKPVQEPVSYTHLTLPTILRV